MGWTGTYKERGKSMLQFFKDEQECINEHGQWEIIDFASFDRGCENYAVFKRTKPDGSTYNFACVFLVRWSKEAHHNIYYKDMDESMGPMYYRCPNRLLALLPPTNIVYANEWRAKCRAYNEKMRKLVKGATIKMDEIVEFTNGDKHSIFRIDRVKSLTVTALDFGGGVYRIKRIAHMNFKEVLDA